MRKILHNNEIICIVANLEEAKEGLDFLSEDSDFIQVGTWNYNKGQVLPLHYHNEFERTALRTSECVFVFKGKIECNLHSEDGHFIEAGENDNLMVQKLVSNPNALAIFGFSFLDQNADKVQGATINGIEPAFENISSGKYPISRPLFFYIKNAHVGVVPGMLEYVEEFLSDAASGEDGYLGEKGLISMPDSERAELNPKVLDLSLIVGDISPSKLK